MKDGRPGTTRIDVAVVGAGPAGIAAAVTLGEGGRKVLLLDESHTPGGQIWRHRTGVLPPAAARPWLDRLRQSGAVVMGGTTVVDVRDMPNGERLELVVERDIVPTLVQASTVVLANGAHERFLPFPGWTLPGVVGVGGAQALLKAGLDVRGKRVVVAGSGPLLLPVASSLAHASARLLLVAEQASRRDVMRFARGLWREPGALLQAARYRAGFRRTRYATGTWIVRAEGGDRVERVTVTDGRRERVLECDLLCAAYGLVSNVRLAQLAGCEASSAGVVVDDQLRTSHARVYAIGETTGVAGVEQAVVEGRIAAESILGRTPSRALVRQRARLSARAREMERAFALRDELRHVATADTIVCRCEDVRLGALQREWTPRQAKLYTRVAMGACQGRVCGAALEFLRGWPPDTTRSPVAPALVSTLVAEPAPTTA